MKTRFKIICNKIIDSYILSFGVFCATVLLVSILQNNITFVTDIVASTTNLIGNFFYYAFGLDNSSIHTMLYPLGNIAVLCILGFLTYYGVKRLEKVYSANNMRNIKRTSNIILLISYTVYLCFFIFNTKPTIEWSYNAIIKVISILKIVLFYDSVLIFPTFHFGFNFALRYLLLVGTIWLCIHIPFFINYLFVEKIPYQSKSSSTVRSNMNISRFTNIIWNPDTKEFRKKNISFIVGLISFAALGFISLSGKNEILDILQYVEKTFKSLLLWSKVEETPFSRPPEIAAFANVAIRVIMAIFYIIETFVCIYVIKRLWSWLNGKNPELLKDEHFKKLVKITAFFPICMFVFYVFVMPNSKADNNEISLWNPFTAVINIIILMALLCVVIYAFLTTRHYIKYYKKKYNDLPENKVTLMGEILKKVCSKVFDFAKGQAMPLLKIDEIYKNSLAKKVLVISSNFAAITSLLTTFVGLLLFFWKDITTGNIILRIINIIICFCFTAAIQYFLLVTGINIGKRFASAFMGKSFWCNLKRATKVTPLLILYIIPMLGSTIFSFSALFAANSHICGYRNIVNEDVWNDALKASQAVASKVVSQYIDNNSKIMEETEKAYIKYNDYRTALNVWEDNNFSRGKDIANTIDNLVMEYNEQMTGIENYKNQMNQALLNDSCNEYKIKNTETRLYHKGENSVYTVIRGVEISKPYVFSINKIDEEKNPFERYDSVLNESEEQTLNKFQFIDTMYREYLNKLIITKNTVQNATVISDRLVNNKYDKDDASSWDLDDYVNSYSDGININKMIYSSFLSFKSILKNNKLSELDNNFTSVEQIPAYMNLYATAYNDDDSFNDDNDLFNKKISCLIEVLNCLNETDNISLSEGNITSETNAISISETIKDIGKKCNYANGCEGNLSFAIDMLFKGKFNLNPNKGIDTVYKHTVFVWILLVLAGIIDLIAVLTGFFGTIIFGKDFDGDNANQDS